MRQEFSTKIKRKPLSRRARVRIFQKNEGICYLCWLKIDPVKQRWVAEHIKPIWLGGADDESNMAPVHQQCAIDKTTSEAPIKAKSDRIIATRLGIRKRSAFACSRDSGWKRKISGEVVRR